MLKNLRRFDDPECCLSGLERTPSQLFLSLLATGEAASRFEANFLAHHNLSHGRLIILWLLDESASGRLRSSELADQAGVSRATITGLLDTLEKDGLVRRSGDPADRRAVTIEITEKGRRQLDDIMPAYFQWIGSALKQLSDTERQTLITLLAKVREAFHPFLP